MTIVKFVLKNLLQKYRILNINKINLFLRNLENWFIFARFFW
jgi:hypothetical protein